MENEEVIRKKFHFEKPIAEKGFEGYDVIRVPGLGIAGGPGMPVLPFKTIKILLPPEGDVTYLSVNPRQEVKIEGSYLIEPGQIPVPISRKENANFTPPNKSVYSSDDPYPTELYNVLSIEYMRGYRILILNLYPVRYYPKSGNISVFPEITVTVKISQKIATTLSVSTIDGKNENYRNLEKDRKRVAALVDNSETVESYSSSTPLKGQSYSTLGLLSSSYDYVIITNNALKTTFQRLADWKNSRGISATVVTVEDIANDPDYNGADLQEEIRNFIKDAYTNWSIEYVLLGGDDEIIPHRGFYVEMGDYTDYDIPSDLYYAALDGTWNNDSDDKWGEPGEEDFYAEVYVGRAPVDDVAEANIFINKTIDYENLSGSEAYLKKTLMVGEKLDDITWGGDYKDEIKDYINPPWTASTLYDRDYTGNDWPKSEIISRMNEGQHLINHLGHSNIGYGLKLYNSDIGSLTNNEYFLVYTQGCYPGAFDSQDSLCENLVKESEHGAFAAICNSRYGWYAPGSTNGASQYYDREFFDAIFNENIRNVGKALQDSKEDNAGLALSSSTMRWVYYELNLFGDPETSIHEPLPEPHDISLTHLEAPTSIKLGKVAEINVTVNNIGQNDENNVEVRLLVDGNINDIETISTLNNGTSKRLNFSWSNETEGTYNITFYAVPVAGEVVISNNILQTDISITATEILLVDDDGSKSYETYYSDALSSYGYSHVMWNVSSQGSPSANDLQSYKIVVWLTGDDFTTTLTSTDQANLQTFLDGGGKLFISGQDIGFDISTSSFYQNYLHANYVLDDTDLYNLSGVSGDPITGYINVSISGGDGADNQDFPDEISPYDAYATAIFNYEGNGAGAIRVDTGTYRLVYLSFGFEAINDWWDRAYLMNNVIGWLDLNPPSVYVWGNGATYVPAGSPVNITAYVYDQSNISSVYAEIESPDENVTAIVQLFDDGAHNDGAANDGTYGNSWTTSSEEGDYYIDFIANDTWGNSGKTNNTDRFTTVPFSSAPDILLVNDYSYSSYIGYYEDALNYFGYSYSLWDPDLRGEIDSSTLSLFKICIWSSPLGGPSSAKQNILSNFLDNGGRLFISGQDIGWSIGASSFYQNYLHANYTQDDVNLYQLIGVSEDPITSGIDIGISGGDGANNQWWPSEVDPIAPAVSIFYYDTSSLAKENMTLQKLSSPPEEYINKTLDYETIGISSTGTGAIRVDAGTYRVVYFAFGFEAVNDQWYRSYLMYKIISWLDMEPPSVYVSGNGATYVPAGSPVNITAYVYDQSNISSVYAEIESPDENVTAIVQLFDDGAHGDGSANDGTYGNTWTTSSDEKEYYIDFIANDTWGNSGKTNNSDRFTTVPFSATSGILLVDDYAYYSYIRYYKDALDYNGYSYNLWDPDLRGEIDNSTINSFKICVWSSPYWPSSNAQSVLREFLDSGGGLFISGQDIGYYIGSTSFYQDYLHANYTQDDVNLYKLIGVSEDPITSGIDIGISGGDGANNQWWPSEVNPIAPATSIFYYDNESTLSGENLTLQELPSTLKEQLNKTLDYETIGISSTGTGAIRVDNGTYRAVYFAFGFEAINNSADRDIVMSRVITWLDTTPPIVTITDPKNNTNFNIFQKDISVAGFATDNTVVAKMGYGHSYESGGGGGWGPLTNPSANVSFNYAINLHEGTNIISITAGDAAGNNMSDSITVTLLSKEVTRQINVTPDNITRVDTKNETDAVLELMANTSVNGTITLIASTDPAELNATSMMGFGALGKYLAINASDNIKGNLSWATIKMYYTQAELDAAGLDPNSITLLWFNETAETWVSLIEEMDWVYGVGREDDSEPYYIWANITHFSNFGAGGQYEADITLNSSDITFSNSNPTEGDAVTITATIHNINDTDANDFKVELLVDGISRANNTLSVTNNSANSTQFTWPSVQGTHSIEIVADADDAIAEVNETNNNATEEITVQATKSPPSGGGGGGGGGSSKTLTAYINNIAPGETGSVAFDSSKSPYVSEIAITVSAKVYNAKISLETLDKKPSPFFSDPTDLVLSYLKITKSNIPVGTLEKADIKFKVEKDWLKQNDIDQDSVVLSREVNKEWEELSTVQLDESSDYVYYSAETPGFSHFVITAEKDSGYVEEAAQIATRALTMASPITTPTTTTTMPAPTAPPITPTPTPSPSIPLAKVGVVLILIAAIAAGAYVYFKRAKP